jgi:hypothetical protein
LKDKLKIIKTFIKGQKKSEIQMMRTILKNIKFGKIEFKDEIENK